MRNLYPILIAILIMIGCGDSQYVPPPPTFKETDLVGMWQAEYGTSMTKDTITLKADGTYQQVFEEPSLDYYYQSPWNKWRVEYSPSGKPKLHLEGMRYYAALVEIGESGGEFPQGYPIPFYDMDDDETVEMINKVILAINGDPESPRGIILWHMQIDPDVGPEFFTLVEGY